MPFQAFVTKYDLTPSSTATFFLDSATQTLLASVNVTSQSENALTYAYLGATVPIQANHGYVVGYNSLAAGNAVDVSSPGNEVYCMYGLYVDGSPDNHLPLLPFTAGTITIENGFFYNYGHGRVPANLFPPSSAWNISTSDAFGICDIAFVQ